MEKVLIRLEIPAIPDSYDIWVPDFLPIKEIIPLLTKAIQELSDDVYRRSGTEQICNCEREQLLNPNCTLKSNGIKNGQHLLLL